MRKIFLTAFVFALTFGSAHAADPVPDTQPLIPSVEQAIEPWSGFHIGALLGYTRDSGADADGADGGIYGGYDAQFGQYVVGIEGDILASGVSGSSGGIATSQDWSGSLRGRAGIALDQFLLYATGGIAGTGVELTGPAGSDTNTLLGWTIGAGVEALIRNGVSARVEYRYADYEEKTFTLGGTPTVSDLETHSVRAGIGVRF